MINRNDQVGILNEKKKHGVILMGTVANCLTEECQVRFYVFDLQVSMQ